MVCSIEDSFLLATEYSQRVVEETAVTDRQQLNGLMSAIRNVSEIASRVNWVFDDEENFMEHYDTPVPLESYEDVYDSQIEDLAELRNEISDNAEEMYSRMAVDEETIWQLKLFFEVASGVDSTRWLLSLANCYDSLTSRAFDSTFDPLRYYEENYGENSNIYVAYDYDVYSSFDSLPDMYEYFSANCANYFDSDTPRPLAGFINYHALFACQSYHTDCDVYVATKHLHANYILNHLRFADEVAETQQDVTQAYFSFINATFNGSYGRPLDMNDDHHECVEYLASYGSDVMRLWTTAGEPIYQCVLRVHLNLCCEHT